MTIQVVCQCGFRKDVPDDWLGMRVKCKCGRSFVISMTGSVEEPPLVEPPVQPQADSDSAEQQRHPDSVAARYRARHRSADSRKRWVLGAGVVISLVCLGSLAFVLRDHLFSGPDRTAQKAPGPEAKPSPKSERQLPASSRHKSSPSGMDNASRFNTAMSPVEQTGPIELEPDDGVLLTDLFGDVSAQLELTEEQLTKRTELTAQFASKAEELRLGKLDLAQWFVDCGKLGGELLAMLTEAQQDRLRELMESGKIRRTRLEAYAAQLRPELATPSVVWRLEADGVPLEPIADATIAVTTTGQPLYTATANGFIALRRADESEPLFDVWNLLENRAVGSCFLPAAAPDDSTRLAAGGQYVVRGGRDNAGNYRVQVWPVAAAPDRSAAPRTMTLPVEVDADTCRLVGCAGGRVLCVAADGFWIWNLEGDEARAYGFSQWAPAGRPTCALSPGGRYVAMAHCHSPTIDGKQYNFLELGIYDSDSGELLGNRVTATDYRPFSVSAVAFSYNGRQIALLWDVAAPDPQRFLVQVSAINGSVLRIAGDLPALETSFAQKKGLPQRELVWLPDDAGWIVGMRGVADTESEAVVDLELPKIDTTDADADPIPTVIDLLPAGDLRLLILTATPQEGNAGALEVRSQIITLPELGPFL